MKKFKKLCCIFLAVALLCVGLAGCGGQDDKDKEITNLSIGGAGTSGTFYILGAAYADLLTKQLGINTVCEVTAGSVENVTLMADGQIEMGVVQLDVTLDALNGTGAFTSPVPLKVLTPMYPNVVQIVTLKDSDINTFEDLRGKRVSVGSPGSGILSTNEIIFQTLGMDIELQKLAERLLEGKDEEGSFRAGEPKAGISERSLREIPKS